MFSEKPSASEMGRANVAFTSPQAPAMPSSAAGKSPIAELTRLLNLLEEQQELFFQKIAQIGRTNDRLTGALPREEDNTPLCPVEDPTPIMDRVERIRARNQRLLASFDNETLTLDAII